MERKSINKNFFINPKNVYRKFRDGNTEIKKIPTGEEIETFWKDIGERNLISIHAQLGLKR